MVDDRLLFRIRLLLWIVIIGLVLSGATAIPLEKELRILGRIAEQDGTINPAEAWIIKVRDGLIDTNAITATKSTWRSRASAPKPSV